MGGIFNGEIPREIGDCISLEWIMINGLMVSGEIPETISNLSRLEYIDLCCNDLTGSLPTFSKCSNLNSIVLGANRLTGSMPLEWANLKNLQSLSLCSNQLSGDIPKEILDSDWFVLDWPDIVLGNSFNDFEVTAPDFYAVDIDGNTITSEEVYAKNSYTIIVKFSDALLTQSDFVNTLIAVYENYSNLGVGIVGNGYFDVLKYKTYNFPWRTFFSTEGNNSFYVGDCSRFYYPDASTGGWLLAVADKDKNIVYDSLRDEISLMEFLGKTFGPCYTSTDYTADGQVTTLQTATVGEGIDIVLMGDGYSDRQIADGTYQSVMEQAYNHLFSEEPYKSHKEYFNVYAVNAVSATEGYDYNNTALSGYFGEGTLVGGDDNAAFTYAQKAISAERMDEAMLVVMMNSKSFGGTCYMYYPTGSEAFGSGVSVSYFPVGTDTETFAQLLHHEANGHGFAKLADEYAYEELGAFPSDQVATYQEQQQGWGWWLNVDFTNDPDEVLWAKFLDDSRYAGEALGCYEGGLTYWSGVWRPTDESIMRYNVGGFNAPSREAIYKRIHHLAYGAGWQYDYETFVEWDARNRTSQAVAARRAAAVRAQKGIGVRQMPAPPVVVGRSWRDAE